MRIPKPQSHTRLGAEPPGACEHRLQDDPFSDTLFVFGNLPNIWYQSINLEHAKKGAFSKMRICAELFTVHMHLLLYPIPSYW